MAVDGYSEEQYERLVREVRSVLQHTLGAKRPHHESSSEVPMIYAKDTRLLVDWF